jgi:hypothetical protein
MLAYEGCAAGGFGCSHGHVASWAVPLLIGIGAVVLAIACVVDHYRRKLGRPPLGSRPREPRTDMSPFTASLLSGQNVQAYTAPVRAVTPGGIPVRYRRCCDRGHQSPAQAVAHAAAVKRRIETTGR